MLVHHYRGIGTVTLPARWTEAAFSVGSGSTITIFEYEGIDTVSPLDQTASNAGTLTIWSTTALRTFSSVASQTTCAPRVTGCIEVTYSGRLLPSDVNLYGVSGETGLDAFLDLTVEEGSTGRSATSRRASEKLPKSEFAGAGDKCGAATLARSDSSPRQRSRKLTVRSWQQQWPKRQQNCGRRAAEPWITSRT